MNLEDFFTELSPDSPCGDNLEYDPAYIELEKVLQGTPEVQYGDTVVAASGPDWKTVKKLSVELLGRSRDLRIAVNLARVLLVLEGIPGFASGLALIEHLLGERWESVHPQLDPDDDFDPMLRVNTLASLVDPNSFLREFKEAPLVSSAALGRFSLRDIDIANGESDASAVEAKPAMAAIDGAFQEVDLERLQEMHKALAEAAGSLSRIESIMTERVGAASAIDLSALSKLIKRALDLVADRVMRRTGVAADSVDTVDDAGEGATGNVQKVVSNEINSREDVLRMFEKINKYYAREEPSSPVPLLIRRAQRLVPMTFMEIMQDMASGGINQVINIVGEQG